MNEWVLSFEDFHNGIWKNLNGRLGCSLITTGRNYDYYMLYFCVRTKSVRTKRMLFVKFRLDSLGLRIEKICGKKSFNNDDLIAVGNKIAEVVSDFERWGKR